MTNIARKRRQHLFDNGVAIGDINTAVKKDADNNMSLEDAVLGHTITLSKLAEGNTKTKENIIMRIDPVGGTSPSEGTIVCDQSEYDALAADLLYVSDALRILPQGLNHIILVYLAPGEYSLRIGDKAVVPLRSFTVDTTLASSSSITINSRVFIGPCVSFIAEEFAEIESSRAGTISAYKYLTVASGTWVVDEHKGKFVEILSGVNVTNIYPIVSNTTDRLFLTGKKTSGACTFRIIDTTVDFVTAADYGTLVLSSLATTNYYNFYGISFNTPTSHKGSISFATPSIIYYSKIINNYSTSFNHSGCRPWGSIIQQTTGSYITLYECIIDTCYIYGILHATYGLILITSGSRLYFFNLPVVEASGVVASPLITLNKGSGIYEGNGCLLVGNGYCIGILAKEETAYANLAQLAIQNCAVALKADGTDLSAKDCGGETYNQSTGNTIAFQAMNGGKIVTSGAPEKIYATTEIEIDGEVETYAELTAHKAITGRYGSQIIGD
jgi:hypothetical protein